MLDGWKETELASKLGRTPSWVSERLSELRTEVLLQNGIFPPITDAEDAALRDSIRRHGVIEPVLVDEDIRVISGSNRVRITGELGVPCPFLILRGLDAEEKRELTIMLNATRRQLTRQQKRKLIEHELMHDGARSDRRIASICGVSHPTVAAVRTEIRSAVANWRALELDPRDAPTEPPASPDDDVESLSAPIWQRPGQIIAVDEVARIPDIVMQRAADLVERRVDTVGRRQPARRSTPPRAPRPVITVTCPCCDTTLTLTRHGTTYTLAPHA